MTAPTIALRKAIHSTLAADAALTTMLGPARIFDDAPREATPPYVTFGDLQSRDWSTTSDLGTEHFLVVNVWSTQRGSREALNIADRVRALIDDQPLTLDGNRLVNLRFVQLETRRENNARFTRASMRFRAVTETN
jgi:Protein of unknown function (DUF3168)